MSIPVAGCVRAYNRGRADYICGLGVEACTYGSKGFYAAFWAEGWADAEKDATEKERAERGHSEVAVK